MGEGIWGPLLCFSAAPQADAPLAGPAHGAPGGLACACLPRECVSSGLRESVPPAHAAAAPRLGTAGSHPHPHPRPQHSLDALRSQVPPAFPANQHLLYSTVIRKLIVPLCAVRRYQPITIAYLTS